MLCPYCNQKMIFYGNSVGWDTPADGYVEDVFCCEQCSYYEAHGYTPNCRCQLCRAKHADENEQKEGA